MSTRSHTRPMRLVWPWRLISRGPACEATIEPAPHAPYYQRIRYKVPDPRPHVTIIIPTKDRTELLSTCVTSIVSRSTYGQFDVLIVDNGSTEPESHAYFERVQQDPCISVLRIDGPFNFSRINNQAAARARGSLLCFLNNDTEVISPDWLEEMVEPRGEGRTSAPSERCSTIPDNTMQHAGVVLGLGGIASHPHRGERRRDAGQLRPGGADADDVRGHGGVHGAAQGRRSRPSADSTRHWRSRTTTSICACGWAPAASGMCGRRSRSSITSNRSAAVTTCTAPISRGSLPSRRRCGTGGRGCWTPIRTTTRICR